MRKTLADIIEPRAEEILSMIYEELRKSGSEKLLASGVVLTGGCANLEGVVELAESAFGLPVRRGYPVGIGGLVDVVNNPVYATGVGLVLHAYRHDKLAKGGYEKRETFKKMLDKGLVKKAKDLFKDIF
jgi:cell division protein FtsA